MAAGTLRHRLDALGRRAPRNAFLGERVSSGYAIGLLGTMLRYMLVALAAVEGIFLSEFVVTEMLPHVLEHGGGAPELVYLTALAIPNGLYLALPVAILAAVYLVFLRRREAGEFTVIAGMGYGSRLLIGIASVAGIASFVGASLMAGLVEPHARYLLRDAVFDIAIEELRTGEIAAGKFHVFGDLAVFASRGRLGDRATGVFVHEHLEGSRNRIVMADRSLGLSSSEGRKAILLDGATVLSFGLEERAASCEGCVPAPRLAPSNVVNLNRFFVGTPALPLPETTARGVGRPNELTTPELLAEPEGGSVTRLLAERLLRGLLCFVAPFLGLAAMVLTGPRTLLLALPLAGGLVLGGSFFGPRAADLLSRFGGIAATGALLAAALAVVIGVVAVVRWQEGRAIGQARVRL